MRPTGWKTESMSRAATHRLVSPNPPSPPPSQHLKTGMAMLCRVKRSNHRELTVSLPNGLTGYIPLRRDAGQAGGGTSGGAVAEDEEEEDDEATRPKPRRAGPVPLAVVGQFVLAAVDDVDKGRGGSARASAAVALAHELMGQVPTGSGTRITMTLDPAICNSGVTQLQLQGGSLLAGVIASVEDHGLVVNVGIAGVTAFLPWANTDGTAGQAGTKLIRAAGAPLWCTVAHADKASHALTLSCRAATVVSTLVTEATHTVHTIKPGMRVDCTVERVLVDGLRVNFLAFFHATVHVAHMDQPAHAFWARRYHAGDKMRARVLYVDPASKVIALSAAPHIMQLGGKGASAAFGVGGPAADVGVNDLVEEAVVLRVDADRGMLLGWGGSVRKATAAAARTAAQKPARGGAGAPTPSDGLRGGDGEVADHDDESDEESVGDNDADLEAALGASDDDNDDEEGGEGEGEGAADGEGAAADDGDDGDVAMAVGRGAGGDTESVGTFASAPDSDAGGELDDAMRGRGGGAGGGDDASLEAQLRKAAQWGQVAYVHISRIADTKVEHIERKFRPGRVLRARLTGVSAIDGSFIATTRDSAVAESSAATGLKVGALVEGTVAKVMWTGDKATGGKGKPSTVDFTTGKGVVAVVRLSEHQAALIPALHVADVLPAHITPGSKSHKAFLATAGLVEGQRVKARVVRAPTGKGGLPLLTLKKSLLSYTGPVLGTYVEAATAVRAAARGDGAAVVVQGVVSGIRTNGVLLSLFGDVSALLPVSDLLAMGMVSKADVTVRRVVAKAAQGGKKEVEVTTAAVATLAAMYPMGQPLQVRLARVWPVLRRAVASLQLAQPAPVLTKKVAPPAPATVPSIVLPGRPAAAAAVPAPGALVDGQVVAVDAGRHALLVHVTATWSGDAAAAVDGVVVGEMHASQLCDDAVTEDAMPVLLAAHPVGTRFHKLLVTGPAPKVKAPGKGSAGTALVTPAAVIALSAKPTLAAAAVALQDAVPASLEAVRPGLFVVGYVASLNAFGAFVRFLNGCTALAPPSKWPKDMKPDADAAAAEAEADGSAQADKELPTFGIGETVWGVVDNVTPATLTSPGRFTVTLHPPAISRIVPRAALEASTAVAACQPRTSATAPPHTPHLSLVALRLRSRLSGGVAAGSVAALAEACRSVAGVTPASLPEVGTLVDATVVAVHADAGYVVVTLPIGDRTVTALASLADVSDLHAPEAVLTRGGIVPGATIPAVITQLPAPSPAIPITVPATSKKAAKGKKAADASAAAAAAPVTLDHCVLASVAHPTVVAVKATSSAPTRGASRARADSTTAASDGKAAGEGARRSTGVPVSQLQAGMAVLVTVVGAEVIRKPAAKRSVADEADGDASSDADGDSDSDEGAGGAGPSRKHAKAAAKARAGAGAAGDDEDDDEEEHEEEEEDEEEEEGSVDSGSEEGEESKPAGARKGMGTRAGVGLPPAIRVTLAGVRGKYRARICPAECVEYDPLTGSGGEVGMATYHNLVAEGAGKQLTARVVAVVAKTRKRRGRAGDGGEESTEATTYVEYRVELTLRTSDLRAPEGHLVAHRPDTVAVSTDSDCSPRRLPPATAAVSVSRKQAAAACVNNVALPAWEQPTDGAGTDGQVDSLRAGAVGFGVVLGMTRVDGEQLWVGLGGGVHVKVHALEAGDDDAIRDRTTGALLPTSAAAAALSVNRLLTTHPVGSVVPLVLTAVRLGSDTDRHHTLVGSIRRARAAMAIAASVAAGSEDKTAGDRKRARKGSVAGDAAVGSSSTSSAAAFVRACDAVRACPALASGVFSPGTVTLARVVPVRRVALTADEEAPLHVHSASLSLRVQLDATTYGQVAIEHHAERGEWCDRPLMAFLYGAVRPAVVLPLSATPSAKGHQADKRVMLSLSFRPSHIMAAQQAAEGGAAAAAVDAPPTPAAGVGKKRRRPTAATEAAPAANALSTALAAEDAAVVRDGTVVSGYIAKALDKPARLVVRLTPSVTVPVDGDGLSGKLAGMLKTNRRALVAKLLRGAVRGSAAGGGGGSPAALRLVLDDPAVAADASAGEGGSATTVRKLTDLHVGSVFSGVVSQVRPFGIFVGLIGTTRRRDGRGDGSAAAPEWLISGLCHADEVADGDDPAAVRARLADKFHAGDRVQVVVLAVNAEKQQVSLSMKPSRFAEAAAGDMDKLAAAAVPQRKAARASSAVDGDGDETMAAGGRKQDPDRRREDSDDDDDDDDRPVAAPVLFGVFGRVGAKAAAAPAPAPAPIPTPAPPATVKVVGAEARKATQARLGAGMDWSDDEGEGDTGDGASVGGGGDGGGDDDGDSAAGPSKATKRKAKKRAKDVAELETRRLEERLASGEAERNPETEDEFERLVAGGPNDSLRWIRYMAWQLSNTEVAKARAVAERALETISYREEQEKLNVWTALMNLEAQYGDTTSLGKVFARAQAAADPKAVHFALLGVYQRAGAEHAAACEALFGITARKFGRDGKQVWVEWGAFKMRAGDAAGARDVLRRACTVLSAKDQIDCTVQFALMEYRFAAGGGGSGGGGSGDGAEYGLGAGAGCGSVERGRTMFESLLAAAPKRLDLWSVYLDQEVAVAAAAEAGAAQVESVRRVRKIYDRVLAQRLSSKKARFLFKKQLAFEKAHGDAAGVRRVAAAAQAYVEKAVAQAGGGGGGAAGGGDDGDSE